MPFYFVQLSGINRPSWPHFRDSQRRLAAAIPFCDFAVSSDKGDPWNVHPTEKAPVGERLARLALNQTYGMNHVAQHGPTIERAVRRGSKIVLSFDNGEGMCSNDGKAIRGFEVQRPDGTFAPTDATIEGGKIIIPAGRECKCVRYAWRPFTDANLINSAGLPASTFEIEVE